MGRQIARRVIMQRPLHWRVQLWNRTPEKVPAVLHSYVVPKLQDLKPSRVVISCVTDVATLRHNVCCVPGVLPSDLWIDCSSGLAEDSVRLYEDLKYYRGVAHVVDAPVSGGPTKAMTGDLTSMVGGSEDDVAKSLPWIRHWAARIIHAGAPGSAQAVKSTNNLLNVTNLCTSYVALQTVGQWTSLDTACHIIAQSSGRSLMTEERIPQDVLSGRFHYGFTAQLMLKDVRNALIMWPDDEDIPAVFEDVEASLAETVKQEGPHADYTRVVHYFGK